MRVGIIDLFSGYRPIPDEREGEGDICESAHRRGGIFLRRIAVLRMKAAPMIEAAQFIRSYFVLLQSGFYGHAGTG